MYLWHQSCCWIFCLWMFFGPWSEVDESNGAPPAAWGRGHQRQLVWRARLATTAPPAPQPPPPHMCHKHGTHHHHRAPPYIWNIRDSGAQWSQSSVSRVELIARGAPLVWWQTVRSEITFTLQDITIFYEACNAPSHRLPRTFWDLGNSMGCFRGFIRLREIHWVRYLSCVQHLYLGWV